MTTDWNGKPRQQQPLPDPESSGGDSSQQQPPSSPLSVSMRPVFTFLKAIGFYAHDPVLVPNSYETPMATAYTIALIFVNIFLFAFNIYEVEKSVLDEGTWRGVPTTSLVIAAIRPIHCAFNLGLFRRGNTSHQRFWQQVSQIDQFFNSRLQVAVNSARIKTSFILSSTSILLITSSLSVSQFVFCPTRTTNSTVIRGEREAGDYLIMIFAPIQCLWQLLPLLYYAHVGWLFLFWYRALHYHVDTDWEEFGRRRRRPLEFYSRQYTKLTEAVFAAGQFFHPIIFFSMAHSTIVLCLAVYFMKNAGAFFDGGGGSAAASAAADPTAMIAYRGGVESMTKKAYDMTWTTLQILIAFVYVLTLCFMRWQLKLRACMVAANILSYNRRMSRDYASIRETHSTLIDRRRQWRRRCRSECQYEIRQHSSTPAASSLVLQSRNRFRRLTILASPRPILPSVWSASVSQRRRENRERDNRDSTFL